MTYATIMLDLKLAYWSVAKKFWDSMNSSYCEFVLWSSFFQDYKKNQQWRFFLFYNFFHSTIGEILYPRRLRLLIFSLSTNTFSPLFTLTYDNSFHNLMMTCRLPLSTNTSLPLFTLMYNNSSHNLMILPTTLKFMIFYFQTPHFKVALV